MHCGINMKKEKYKPCEVCTCEDCRDGHDGRRSWHCPVLKKQICDICCVYDADAADIKYKGKQMRVWCKKEKCKKLE